MKGKNFLRGLSKVLSVLLSFALIIGALPVIAQADSGTNYTYQRVSSLTNGGVYVICVKPGSSYLAMNNTISGGYAGTTSGLTVSGDGQSLTSADAGIQWTYTSSGSTLKNGSNYLVRSSGSDNLQLVTNASGYNANWTLNSNKLYLGSNSHYLYYNATSGVNASGSSSSGATVYLFQQVSRSVSSIAIKTPPTKTTYIAGVDSFDPTGMVITATYNDATTEDISSGYNSSPSGVLPASTTSVSISYGGQSTSQAVTMNAAPPDITTQPDDTAAYVGDSVSLSVAATVADGGTRSYQWYSNTSNSNTEGSIISEATGTSYTVPTTTTGAYYYYCVVTNTDNVVNGTKVVTTNTRAATVTINENPQSPNISGQPSGFSEYVGDTSSLSVTANSLDNGTLSYQWYNNGSNSSTYGGSAISGATGSSYQPSSATVGTIYYYCAVSNTKVPPKKATVNSSIAGVTVNPVLLESITVSTPPTKTIYNEGETFESSGMVVTANYNNDNHVEVTEYTVDPSGALTPDDHAITITYNGKTATQNITVHTNAATPVINTDTPVDWLAADVGETVSLSVTAHVSKGTLTYQWYSDTTGENSGGSSVGLSSGDPSLTLDTSTAGTTYYYCVVTNTDPTATGAQTATATSRVAQVVVRKDAQAPIIDETSPVDMSAYKNSSSSITVSAYVDSGVLTYQWYSNTTGLNSGGTLVGSQSSNPSLTLNTSTVGTTYYYCVVTNTDTGAPGIKTATATSRAARVDISAFTKGMVLFTFDDGWDDQYTNAYPILNAAGFKATAYVNSEFIQNGDSGFMSLSHVKALNNAGWDIGNHTSNHSDIGDLTDQAHMAELKTIYTDCATWLISNGMSRAAYHVAYPSGLYSSDLIRLLKNLGYDSGRATMFGQQYGIQYQNDYFKLPVYSVGDDDDMYACLDGIDLAAAGGSTIILMIHKVEPNADDLVTTIDQLQEIVDKVKTKVDAGQISVMTITEWCAVQNQSPSGQTPPAPAVTNDDVANTVSGLNLVMEYKLDDAASYTAYDPATFNSLNLTGNHTLAVRYAASGVDPAGPDEVLTFNKALSGIEITTPPKNTVYTEGKTFDATDMVVTAHYDDGTSEAVTGYTIAPSGELAVTDAKVTVSYTYAGITKTIDQPITVNAKKLSSIEITAGPTNTTYVEGTLFDPAGMVVTAHYDNDTSETVTDYTIAPSGKLAITDTKVTVSYTFADVTRTADQTIMVNEKALSSIAITTPPKNTDYIEGNDFDRTDMVVTAYYNNGTSEAVTGYITTPSTGLVTSDTKVVVSYDYKGVLMTAEQPITVNAKSLTGIAITKEPLQKVYTEGNVFNSAGMVVTAYYDNDTYEDVLGYSITPSGTLATTDTKVTVSYTFSNVTRTADQIIAVHAKSLTRIEISAPPSKTTYVEGDVFNSAGMAVTAYYDNDTSAVVTGYSVDPAGALTISDVKVTVSYTYVGVTETAEQPITVNAKKLRSIAITTAPSKTQYLEGQTFDATDMVVTAYFDNGTHEAVTNYSITPSGELAVTDTKVTVSYTFAGVTMTADQPITVALKSLHHIEITTPPSKTDYIEGNHFDPADMVVTAYYDNGTNAAVTGYSIIPSGELAITDTKVIVNYGGKTAEQVITVAAKSLDHIVITSKPAKTQYIEGQVFDPAGMVVTACFDNGTNGLASGFSWKPDAALTTADKKVTVSLTYDGVTKTADQGITVTAKAITGLDFKTHPTTVNYVEGQTFNPAGMVLIATYNDGSSKELQPSVCTFSINRTLKATDTSIDIIYDSMRVTQNITVLTKAALQLTCQDNIGAIFPIGLAIYSDSGLTHMVDSKAADPVTGVILFSGLDAGTYYVSVASVPSPYHLPSPSVSVGYTVAYGQINRQTFVLPKALVYSYTSVQLKDIAATAGTLSPVFDPETKSYTLLLDEYTAKTTIMPVLADASSKLYINGKKVSSKTFTLATAKKTKVTIKVQPKTGKAMTYTVTVMRAASTNTSLAYIKASKGSLTKNDSTNYTVNISNTQTSTAVSLKLADKTAKYTMMLDGKKTKSKTVSMKPGTTRTLVITVTPQAGSAYAVTYTVTIVRAISHNDYLAALKPSKGALAPAFNPELTDYSIALPSMYSSTRLTIKQADSTAKYAITVDGKKSGSTISVGLGATKVVTITVTSQAGDIKTYNVTITRAAE